MARQSAVAGWLHSLGRGEGLTVAKALRSPLLEECDIPAEWPRNVAGTRLVEAVTKAIQQLPNEDDRLICLAVFNRLPPISGNKSSSRLQQLVRLLGEAGELRSGRTRDSPSMKRRWATLRLNLAVHVIAEIERRNRDGWLADRDPAQEQDGAALQPFVVDRLEVAHFIDRNRICTETMTHRLLTADRTDLDESELIDHYIVRARYAGGELDGEHAERPDILPFLNCTGGDTIVSADGWVSRPMYFPKALGHDESIYFASRVTYKGRGPTDPLAYIQVTSLGVLKLHLRVQFDPEFVPASYWVYGGPQDPELGSATKQAEPVGKPNQVGYIEYEADDCPPEWFYAVGWTWD